MNFPVNPTLTMIIAADRQRALVADADARRIRAHNRAARKAARRATRNAGPVTAVTAVTAAPPVRPQLHPVPTGVAVVGQAMTPAEATPEVASRVA